MDPRTPEEEELRAKISAFVTSLERPGTRINVNEWSFIGDVRVTCAGALHITAYYCGLEPGHSGRCFSFNKQVPFDPESGLSEQKWEIWAEGYRATGESSRAQRVGEAWGITFKQACQRFYAETDDNYDPNRNTYWGCRLFPSEAEARKSFG